jgi:Zn-dependent protease
MGTSWKIGRVAGINLYLHPTFLLLLVFGAVQWGLDAVSMLIAVFACVVLHELGHALTARMYGIGTEDITLYPIGGVARLQRMPRKPGAEFLIALAGPMVNLAIAGVLTTSLALGGAAHEGSWAGGPGPIVSFLSTLVAINLLLAGFNLLPAFPMDGGRVLRALLSGWLGRLRATEIAAGLGKILAVGFGVWSLAQGDLVRTALAVFIYFAAQSELRQARIEERRRMTPPTDQDGLRFAPPGYHWVNRGEGVWYLAPVFVSVTDHRTPPRWP